MIVLKDKLANIAIGTPKTNCLLGSAMSEMDKETLDAFIRAMNSGASAAEIMRVLNEEGITSFKITHLRDKRRDCFKSGNECPCIKEARNG